MRKNELCYKDFGVKYKLEDYIDSLYKILES